MSEVRRIGPSPRPSAPRSVTRPGGSRRGREFEEQLEDDTGDGGEPQGESDPERLAHLSVPPRERGELGSGLDVIA